MAEPENTDKRRIPETEIQVAAAAITAAISPPLGIAVAAGSALRSRRVREALRKGTVNALANAMELSDQLSRAAAARAAASRSDESAHNGESSTVVPKR
jgi:hypothetical protein